MLALRDPRPRVQGSLSAMMLDTKRTFDGLVEKYASDEEARDRILNNQIYQYVASSLAGTQEYMAMEKLHEVRKDPAVGPRRARHAPDRQRPRFSHGARATHRRDRLAGDALVSAGLRGRGQRSVWPRRPRRDRAAQGHWQDHGHRVPGAGRRVRREESTTCSVDSRSARSRSPMRSGAPRSRSCW